MADQYDGSTRKARYEQLRGSLLTDRSSFDLHWQELADFLQPRRTRFFASDRNRGDKRSQKIIDSTARFSFRTLQSGLHAGLTSPARPWFRLTTPDPDLAESAAVKAWLHTVTQRMAIIFIQSNLYNVLPTVYGDMGGFGTAAMAVVEDAKETMRCYSYPIGSYALGMDERGIVNTFVRDYQLTVRQIVHQFGVQPNRDIDWSHISNQVHTLWDRGNYEAPIDVTWIVTPNEQERSDRLGAKYFPFASCTFEHGADRDQFLRESGYRQNPILAPRWDVTGEDSYGTDCPGMTALGDVKQLQTMQRKKAQAIAKLVDPPLVGPTALRNTKTSLHPGEITFVDTREGMAGLRSIHEIGLNLQHLTGDIGETQYRIQRAFYEDLFLMLARADAQRGTQPATAREIEERHEEKLLALGPVLERTDDELLDPLIDRVYDMMFRGGLIPEPPPELHGVDLKVEYISIMAQAQKLVGVVGQDRFLQTIVPLITPFPEIRHKVDVFRLIDNYGDMLGLDPRTIVPTDQAKTALAAEAQQQKAMSDAQQADLLAKATRNASQSPMGGDTALSRVLGNVSPSPVPQQGAA